MYDVLSVCAHIIRYSNQKEYILSNLKLQKVLYYLQAEFLVEYGKRCFGEKIIAWDFGPVVLEAYREYKSFGSCHIFRPSPLPYQTIRQEDAEVIEAVVDALADISSTQLLKVIHQQSPWKNYYLAGLDNEIPVNVIKDYFSY